MKATDKIAQAHLDAIPLLLRPLVECMGGKPITSSDAHRIIREWDHKRKP